MVNGEKSSMTVDCSYFAHSPLTIHKSIPFYYFFASDSSCINDNPSFCKRLISTGIELGPIPCSCKISFWLNLESCCKLVIPLFSNARRAGAERLDRKPSMGLRSCSQIGQTGQSLLLLYPCPLGQILKPILFVFCSITFFLLSRVVAAFLKLAKIFN